jgi:3-phenylpropionate/cinnamic acid dioxygenase small subunit
VAQLEDYEAIRRLIALYAQLLDAKRLDEWAEVFTFDAVFEVWGQSYKGRSEIVKAIGGMQPEFPGKHVSLMPVIDLLGSGRARAWTDFSAFASSKDGITIATIGRYHDELVLQGGRWRFARRVVVMPGEALPKGVAPSPGV